MAELECRINDPASHEDPARSRQLGEEHERLRTAIDAAYQTWEILSSELESLAGSDPRNG